MMKRTCLSASALLCYFAYLNLQWVLPAEGKVEHYSFDSFILAEVGQPSNRGLSVYLPQEYDVSEFAYPVLYLIHGGSVNCNASLMSSRVWFSYGFDAVFGDLPEPLIIVMPSMGGCNRIVEVEQEFLAREIVPFVETRYRVIPTRNGRAVAGLSRGGADALHIALAYPDLFSLSVGISSGGQRALPEREILERHPQERFSLEFWLAYGQHEEYNITADNRAFADILSEVEIPYEVVEDNGSHFDPNAVGQRFTAGLVFASQALSGSIVSVTSRVGLTTTWAEIRRL